MHNINHYAARSGRVMREDNSVVNEADGINDDGSRNVVVAGNDMERYGRSTDIKPTTGVRPGTSFLELDTKDIYIFDGADWGLK